MILALPHPFKRRTRMEWINLRTASLRLPEYIGSAPVHRATWLNLLAYCVEQENGGRIVGAMTWGDRQWQQTCGVTRGEVKAAKPLVTIVGKDVLVWAYPHEKEREVQAKRQGGKEAMERRWAKHRANGSATSLPPNSVTPASNSADNSVTSLANTEGEGEGEGNPPPLPARARERACASELESTWTLILSVLRQKKRRAGYEAEHALSRQAEHLPLSAEDAELLRWFYALPHEERDIDLRARFRDADKLAINLMPALERARAYREKKNGAPIQPPSPAPDGWQEWYRQHYADKPVPASFADLPEYLRDDCRRALKGGSRE